MWSRLLCCLSIFLASVAPLSAADRPNVIVILSDDMGYSDLGCYGGEIRTPNLDGLAANGLRFSQFYNTGRCCPTRASLLTGLYPHQAGVGHMTEDRGHPGYSGGLNEHCVTIAEALRPAGYATYATGKWHVVRNDQVKPEGPKHNWPLQRGFDRFYGTITGAGSFYDPGTLTRDNAMISPLADPEYKPETYYYTHAISDHAIRFVEEHREQHSDKPFFLYVAYTAAHWPMHALEADVARYRGKYDAGYEPIRKQRLERLRELGLIPPTVELSPQTGDWSRQEHPEWEVRCMEVYAAMIDSMDHGIGRIVQTLREQRQLDNTLIFFLQDNGGCQETVGRKAREEKVHPVIAADAVRLDVIPVQTRDGQPVVMGPGHLPGGPNDYIAYGPDWANTSNTPFREYKHFVHEGGISTPLIVHWPQGLKRTNEIEHQPGHLIDLMATCIDVAGATYPTERNGQPVTPREGVSLRPAFAGKSLERSQPLFWEHEGNQAIRDGQWKLVAKENQPWELYDMVVDRSELHDLAETHPGRVQQMSAWWSEWAARANVLPLGGWRTDSKTRAAHSPRKSFELKAGDALKGADAPDIENRRLEIVARYSAERPAGVLLAQGGSAHGYALWFHDSKLHVGLRRGNKLSEQVIAAEFGGEHTLSVVLETSGKLSVTLDGQPCKTGELPGGVLSQPADGLQVGRDDGGRVGEYTGSSPFAGKIESIQLKLGE